jgi:hypothetical protein
MISAEEVRRSALSLPEAEERETWGHPTFRVGDKLFATLSDDGLQAGVKATRQEQAALLAADPDTFGVPAYVGRHGWISVQLATVDPGELRELLVEGPGVRPPPGAWSPPTTPARGSRRNRPVPGR